MKVKSVLDLYSLSEVGMKHSEAVETTCDGELSLMRDFHEFFTAVGFLYVCKRCRCVLHFSEELEGAREVKS